jgi:hypothetical protein
MATVAEVDEKSAEQLTRPAVEARQVMDAE